MLDAVKISSLFSWIILMREHVDAGMNSGRVIEKS